ALKLRDTVRSMVSAALCTGPPAKPASALAADASELFRSLLSVAIRMLPHQLIQFAARQTRRGRAQIPIQQRAPFRQRHPPEDIRRKAQLPQPQAQAAAPGKGSRLCAAAPPPCSSPARSKASVTARI